MSDQQTPPEGKKTGEDGNLLTQGSETQQSQTTPTTTPPAWKAQLKDDLKSNVVFDQFQTISDLGSKYIELEGRLKDTVPKPKADATPEEKKAFYQALGVPDTPDKYNLPEIADIKVNPELAKNFKALAHSLHFDQQQASDAYKWLVENSASETKKAQQEYTVNRENAVKELQKEWGGKFEENVSTMRNVIDKFGGDELKKVLDETGLGNNPILAKVFAKIGQAISPDRLVTGSESIQQKSLGESLYPKMMEQLKAKG